MIRFKTVVVLIEDCKVGEVLLCLLLCFNQFGGNTEFLDLIFIWFQTFIIERFRGYFDIVTNFDLIRYLGKFEFQMVGKRLDVGWVGEAFDLAIPHMVSLMLQEVANLITIKLLLL